MRLFSTLLITATVLFSCWSCSSSKEEKIKLVFLSGAGMKDPVMEIAQEYEQKTGVRIETVFEGSSILRDYILKFRSGDIFLPGDKKNLDQLREHNLVSQTSFIAWHVVAILVSPEMKGTINSLDDLAGDGIRLVISNPKLASLGRLVMDRIIDKHPDGQKILKNITVYGSSTQDVLRIYREGGVDAVIEWDVMAATKEGRDLTVVPIEEKYAVHDELMVGLLNTSKYPEEAGRFFEYLISEGKTIFKKHGYNITEPYTHSQ